MQYLGSTQKNGIYTMQFAFDAPDNYRDMLKFLDLVIDKDDLIQKNSGEKFRFLQARSHGEPFLDNTHLVNSETGNVFSDMPSGEYNIVAIEGHSSYLNSPVRMVMTKHSPICQIQVSEKDFEETGQSGYIEYGRWLECS